MRFFEGARLSAGKNLMHRIPQRVGLRLRARVKKVTAGQTVRSRDLVIQPGNEIVLVGDGCHIRIEGLDAGDVRRASGRERPQGQIRLDRRYGGCTLGGIRHMNGSGSLLALAKSFVSAKDKRSILYDRSPGGTTKLDTAERSNRRSVKIVTCIKNTVTIKKEPGSVNVIGA